MSWGDVGKPQGGSQTGRFVQFKDGEFQRMRILDLEPHTTQTHKISQIVQKLGKSEEVFRSVPATENPDDSYVLKHAAKRYPEQAQYNMRVFLYNKADNKPVPQEGEILILQGGNAIFKPLKDLFDQHGSLTQFDIIITRKGEGRLSEYSVSAAPFALRPDLDIEAMVAKKDGDVTLKWENVFPKITAAEQQKIITEAGFSISYDPAAVIAASMSQQEASSTKFTFGKYKDKPIGEIAIIDAGYLAWAAENVTSADNVAAACRVMVAVAEGRSLAQAPVQQQLPPAPKQTAAAQVIDQPKLSRVEQAEAAAAAAEAVVVAVVKADKAALIEQANDYFEQDPRFTEIPAIVEIVKRHGGGKTRVRDLTEPQLQALLAELAA